MNRKHIGAGLIVLGGVVCLGVIWPLWLWALADARKAPPGVDGPGYVQLALFMFSIVLVAGGVFLIVFGIGRLASKHAMSLSWNLPLAGWASCVVADDHAAARLAATCSTSAPEDLLHAVTRLAEGERETWALFDSGSAAFRWVFSRDANDVQVRVLQLADIWPGDAGIEIWSSRQAIGTVVRSVVRCFDDVLRRYGEDGYRGRWQQPFPRRELEALRAAWPTAALARASAQQAKGLLPW